MRELGEGASGGGGCKDRRLVRGGEELGEPMRGVEGRGRGEGSRAILDEREEFLINFY